MEICSTIGFVNVNFIVVVVVGCPYTVCVFARVVVHWSNDDDYYGIFYRIAKFTPYFLGACPLSTAYGDLKKKKSPRVRKNWIHTLIHLSGCGKSEANHLNQKSQVTHIYFFYNGMNIKMIGKLLLKQYHIISGRRQSQKRRIKNLKCTLESQTKQFPQQSVD